MFKSSLNQSNYFLQIILLAVLVLSGLFVFGILSIILVALVSGNFNLEYIIMLSEGSAQMSVADMKLMQLVASTGVFVVPAVVFALLISGNVFQYLRLRRLPDPTSIGLAVAALILAGPFIYLLTKWNSEMALPDFLKGMEVWMRASEDKATEILESFLHMPRFSDLIVNLLMMAVLPAIGEELVFRGVIQMILWKGLDNIHIAIFLSAIFFSAIHLQFYGFFPRMLLNPFHKIL